MVPGLLMSTLRKEKQLVFKRLFVSLSLALSVAGIATASPLHSSDPNYRGAFTLLAAASTTGASAKYSTQINMVNVSDHTVHIRVELYSTTGYREGILVNTLPPANGSERLLLGGSQPNWEFTNTIGADGMEQSASSP